MSRSVRDNLKAKLRASVNSWSEGCLFAAQVADHAHDQHPEIEEAIVGLIEIVKSATDLLADIRAKL